MHASDSYAFDILHWLLASARVYSGLAIDESTYIKNKKSIPLLLACALSTKTIPRVVLILMLLLGWEGWEGATSQS